ncbi:MAG: hypothetical protein WC253_06180 [Sulfurovaceae bacterium]|jgi:hypothetical protein|nr:hypothetical protein [Sulfurovaceae bacterium]
MWIYQDNLERGTDDFPQIAKTTQAKARKAGKLQFVKIGRNVVYKREWIEQYLKSLQQTYFNSGARYGSK